MTGSPGRDEPGSQHTTEGPRPSSEARPAGDYLSILSGAAQNVIGIGVAALALFVVQVLMTRTLGEEGFGLVTIITQAAFVASFITRFGMDMAVLRDVAIEVGVVRRQYLRSLVARAAAIAALVSACAAVLLAVFGNTVSALFAIEIEAGWLIPAAALGLPFLALANVWLAATRGLKIMRYTLYVFWAGQNIVWIALTLVLWRVETSAATSILAYSLSWAWAAGAAWYFWRKESRAWESVPPPPGWLQKLLRYAGPRAPAALFAQLLFWADLFVLTLFASAADVGVYSAALRAGQIAMLFLTSVNLMFGPYVADLHNRGLTKQLDALYKTLTRWIVAATLPIFLLIAVAPSDVMRIFGSGFARGETALLILLGGQLVNIATGSAGFVLIMAGRTGWDLLVYVGSLAFDIALALWLCRRYGMEGAAATNALTFAASNCLRLVLVKRFVRIQPYDAAYLRLLVPAGLSLFAMWLIHGAVDGNYLVRLLATGAGGALFYLIAYARFGLTDAERRGAAGLFARLKPRSG